MLWLMTETPNGGHPAALKSVYLHGFLLYSIGSFVGCHNMGPLTEGGKRSGRKSKRRE